MSYEYKDGIQNYVNKDIGNKGRSTQTTFQKRGYLSIKCDPDYLISRSDKSIDEQVAAIAEISAKHKGKLDEKGDWKREGDKFQQMYTDVNYQSREELAYKRSRSSESHGEFHNGSKLVF